MGGALASLTRFLFRGASRAGSHGIRLGKGSVVENPRSVNGGKNIHIGERSWIGEHACLSAYDSAYGVQYSPKLTVGDDVYIGSFSTITCISRVTIGAGCVMSE